MEQQLATGLGEGEIAQLVQDQEVEPAEEIGRAALAIGAGLGVKLVDQVDGVEEAAPPAAPDAGWPARRRCPARSAG